MAKNPANVEPAESKFDAVIIGAGPAGGVAALRLARAGWRVALVEKKEFPRRKVCGEFISATNEPLLRELGLLQEVLRDGGPDVTRTAIFCGDRQLEAALPTPANTSRTGSFGRGVPRQVLDTLLRDRAREAGAIVFQPAQARELTGDPGDLRLIVETGGAEGKESHQLRAPVIISAHGSWERGNLPSQPARGAGAKPGPDDLFGFKAHFTNTQLRRKLMPLLVFAGGYGGMVHVSRQGRVSISLCLRHEILQRLQENSNGLSAGELAGQYVREQCLGVDNALNGAQLEGKWLAAGPIRPGIRARYSETDGLFRVGNAAGEAHPVVAEGITMAMQSSWLLTEELCRNQPEALDATGLAQVGRQYSRRYREAFEPRIRAAAGIARCAMSTPLRRTLLPVFQAFPALITFGARLTGKTHRVV